MSVLVTSTSAFKNTTQYQIVFSTIRTLMISETMLEDGSLVESMERHTFLR
jgi:hypothetical protein